MSTKSFLLTVAIITLFVCVAAEAAQPTQQYSKMFLSPFYLESMVQNTNYSYNVSVNPPDGVSEVKSAILTLDSWMNPSRTFYAYVNGVACRSPNYTISTTYAGSGRAVLTFDCGNIINGSGNYVVKFRVTGGNIGASTAWLDLTYLNSPSGVMTMHGTEYRGGDPAKAWLQLLNSSGVPVTGAVCYLTSLRPNGSNFITSAAMEHQGSGIYSYDYLAPMSVGVYPNIADCFYTATQNPFNTTNYTIINGTLSSGTVNDTRVEDGVYQRFQEVLIVAGDRRLSIQYNISAAGCLNTSPSLLTGGTVGWVGRWPATPNNDVITIYYKNQSSGLWTALPNTIPDGGTSFQTVTNSLSFTNLSLSNLVTPNGTVQLWFNDTAGLTDGANNNWDIDRLSFSCDQLGSPVYQETHGSSEMHVSGDVYDVETCGGKMDGRCAVFTNDAEFDLKEGEIEDFVNITVISSSLSANVVYTSPFTVDCAALYWIKVWNGTDWTNYTDYTTTSEPATERCSILLINSVTAGQQDSFWLKFDNYMGWEAEYSRNIIVRIENSTNEMCAGRNFTYDVPITEATNTSNDTLTDFCHRLYDDFYYADYYYNASLSAADAGEMSSYLAEIRFYRNELYEKYIYLSLDGTSPLPRRTWEYPVRNLTYYETVSPNVSVNASFDASAIAGYVWNATNRTLTADPTNTTAVAEAVWSFTTRNLTDYPVQVDLTNYTLVAQSVWNYGDTITSVIITQVATGVWNYSARYTHGELL